MEQKPRRKFSAEFKAKVAIVAIQEWNRIEEFAKERSGERTKERTDEPAI